MSSADFQGDIRQGFQPTWFSWDSCWNDHHIAALQAVWQLLRSKVAWKKNKHSSEQFQFLTRRGQHIYADRAQEDSPTQGQI